MQGAFRSVPGDVCIQGDADNIYNSNVKSNSKNIRLFLWIAVDVTADT